MDAEGNPITALQHLQLAVDQYDRLRPGSGGDDQHPPWPPLTDLSQLVKVGLAKSLPPAPSGQKFMLDLKTMRVNVVSQ
ncbi:MAG: hypothetical protein HYZ36_05290 [Pedosphaera parvula]|nr:hypothetical protein [Pedosphaera parvula]